MKKRIIWIGVAVLIVVIIAALVYVGLHPRVGTFDLAEYESFIEEFPSGEAYGSAATARDALKIAEDVWRKTYGEDCVKHEKPHWVSYDAKNGVWLVHGSLPFFMLGGTAYILIEKDSGKVLAVWHYQ